ncbi:hypothetical protein CP533_5045 [Ophiocordyceps camponoti-saundersi (nom. inval.)]|nr:hypothetical protein CP533_5045 [Ophiocordyceps camponoti-saundersi (nom. inval.)]
MPVSGYLVLDLFTARLTSLAKRGGGDRTSGQLLALNVTCIVIAGLSVISTLLASFCFLRVSKNFRYEHNSLIVLLLQIDLVKSLVLLIVPSIELVKGPVQSGSITCTIAGFVLLIALEACNIAIVLLALHTALNVFCGEGGLYPHRRIGWVVCTVLPLALALLAFINRPAFVNSGRFCRVPARPSWPRLVLIWLPRAVCLVIIVFTYVATFIHVQTLVRRFDAPSVQGWPQAIVPEPSRPPLSAIAPRLPDTLPPREPGVQPVLTLASVTDLRLRQAGVESTTAFLSPRTLADTGMDKTRGKVRRHLRLLFIYPIVYIGLWLVPFICHIVSRPEHGESFGLTLTSIASLSLQGTADAFVFTMVEKPWRLPGQAGARRWMMRSNEGAATHAGRNRDEMRFDSRVARRRREGELAAERLLRRMTKQNTDRIREWWDVRQENESNDNDYDN